jgi:hypothetical protein
MAEKKILDMLMYDQHFWLMIGIFCFMYVVRCVPQIDRFLFTPKWKWTIVFINLALSCIGVFAFGMTSATTNGMKIVIVLLLSAVTLLAHEITKPILRKLIHKIFGVEIKPVASKEKT